MSVGINADLSGIIDPVKYMDFPERKTVDSYRSEIGGCKHLITEEDKKLPGFKQHQTEFDIQQTDLNRRITKTSSHITRVNKNLKGCKSGKTGRAKHRNLQVQKQIHEEYFQELGSQSKQLNRLSDIEKTKEKACLDEIERLSKKVTKKENQVRMLSTRQKVNSLFGNDRPLYVASKARGCWHGGRKASYLKSC